MRERALMVGGTLTVGPAESGGFEVDATLPVAGAAS
jgi:signal transduction histidine kinase